MNDPLRGKVIKFTINGHPAFLRVEGIHKVMNYPDKRTFNGPCIVFLKHPPMVMRNVNLYPDYIVTLSAKPNRKRFRVASPLEVVRIKRLCAESISSF